MIALEQRASEPIVSEVFKRALLRRWDLQDASGATAARAAVRRCSHSMAWLWQTETRQGRIFRTRRSFPVRGAERPLAAAGGCRTTADEYRTATGECRTAAGVIAVTIPEVVSSHNKPIQEIAGPFDAHT
jgi:hypothetical protein